MTDEQLETNTGCTDLTLLIDDVATVAGAVARRVRVLEEALRFYADEKNHKRTRVIAGLQGASDGLRSPCPGPDALALCWWDDRRDG